MPNRASARGFAAIPQPAPRNIRLPRRPAGEPLIVDGEDVTALVGAERCLRWDDADVGIDWPLLGGGPSLLSAKDAAGRALPDADVY